MKAINVSLEADHLSSLPTPAVSLRLPVLAAMKLKNTDNSNRLMLLNAQSQKQPQGQRLPLEVAAPLISSICQN